MKKLTHQQVDKEIGDILEEQERVKEQTPQGRAAIEKLRTVKENRQTGTK